MTLQVCLTSTRAQAPRRGSPDAAGLDLFSAEDCSVPAHGKATIATDIAIVLPESCYGRIAPRSGLAVKYCIHVGAGVVDPDYRGNISVVLFNFGTENFAVNRGDAIAQLICEKYVSPQVEIVSKINADTERGCQGFGSSDKKIRKVKRE